MDRGCSNCYYGTFDGKAYPCSLCIRGIPREDMWHPMLLQQKTDTPQTAKKVGEFQALCGIEIDPDDINRRVANAYAECGMNEAQTDCGWK